MITFDRYAYRLKHFKVKREQLLPLLDKPLLLFWGKWDNPNVRALTLCEDFTRPTFVVVKPDGETTAIMQQIEVDQMTALDGSVESVGYKFVPQLKEELERILPPGAPVYIETSDKHWGFDLLPPQFLGYLQETYDTESAEDVLLPWRAVKTDTELYLMKLAAQAILAIFDKVEATLGDGVPEAEVLKLIRRLTLDMGGVEAFWPIVASGPRSANPHPARESDRIMRTGDKLLIDYGVAFMGYRSDMTRTYIVGGAIEDDPYYPASLAIREFTETADLSEYNLLSFGEAITGVIESYGLADLLMHGHGHGLGAETHDPYPYITTVEHPYSKDPFKEGLVFTMEPGFYDETGGVRLEDDYAVVDNRAVRLQDLDVEVKL
ncbi:MAG: aminopeptidase P family protein [bacterium]|nr:aminopeptidase P family protein [bacterium]